MNKKLLFLTGAGISAESGIQTFRGDNGLWDQNLVDEIANIYSWNKKEKKERILEFHKKLFLKVKESKPNKGHFDLVRLEEMFDEVMLVTQNVDDLHERAGSKNIVHLHGEINKICNESKTFIT